MLYVFGLDLEKANNIFIRKKLKKCLVAANY